MDSYPEIKIRKEIDLGLFAWIWGIMVTSTITRHLYEVISFPIFLISSRLTNCLRSLAAVVLNSYGIKNE